MPLDPQVGEVLAATAALGQPPLNELSPQAARRQMLENAPAVDEELKARRVRDAIVPGPEADIPVRLYYPAGESPFATLVYFHGGGWVIGDLDTHHALCHALAASSGCLVASVDYRLAPEHRFPAAVDDAYAATSWIAANAASIDADAARLAVGGDSAGGNLAAVVSLMARERGGPRLAFQLLVYPITDVDLDTPSYIENAEGYLLTRDLMIWFWDHYTGGDLANAKTSYASPLRAADLGGLPAALVLTAEYDPLRDEGEAYARRLADAGVHVTCKRYDGMVHGFFRMTAQLDRAREALEEVAAELSSNLAAASRRGTKKRRM